jgi:hypothetical protein
MIDDILNKIERIKESYPDPQCYFVASILSVNFAGSILYNSNHCIFTNGNGVFFDKRGLVDPVEVIADGYLYLSEFGWNIEKTLIEAMLEKHGK